jgi:hypothetical protein
LYTIAVCDSLVVPSSRRSRGYYPTALVSSLYALLPKPAAKARVYRKVVLSSSLQLLCIPCLRSSCVLLSFFNIRGAKSKHLPQHQIVTLTAIRNSLCTFVCAQIFAISFSTLRPCVENSSALVPTYIYDGVGWHEVYVKLCIGRQSHSLTNPSCIFHSLRNLAIPPPLPLIFTTKLNQPRP